MKKLMFAVALAGAMTGVCDVTSSNCVGYINDTNLVGKTYAPVGAMFMKVGGTKGAWKLGDIKPKNGALDFSTEYLQEFNPTTGGIGQKYCYIDETTANTIPPMMFWPDKSQAIGWWKKDTVGGMAPIGPGTAVKADDVEFKAGQGLCCNFVRAKAKFDFSGEVVCEEWQLDLTGKTYAMIINYLARPIKLGEIVPENGCLDFSTEYIQEFNPTTGGIGQKYCYIDETTANTIPPMMFWPDKSQAIGWWKKDTVGGMAPIGPGTAVKADDVEIQPGAGYCSNFVRAKAKFNFPSSILEEK